ncbi:MAG: ribulose-phosphate 3-epimerase [Candidatus Thermoplasmatota archaeon]|nr:ribulose-phosphate 3-epimerase [Candidatus Thermoplasmatota archaeon]
MAVKIAPSIISADFAKLGEELKFLENANAELIHVDVMDGHFVPNITIGAGFVKALRSITRIPLDVHLMIQYPEKLVSQFESAGCDIITVHLESKGNISKALELIKSYNLKRGLAINPATKLSKALKFLNKIDVLLIMTVEPGFAGQKFMPSVIPKLEHARKVIDREKLNIELEVDGGINLSTAKSVIKAGADILVAGSFIFTGNIAENIRTLRAVSC